MMFIKKKKNAKKEGRKQELHISYKVYTDYRIILYLIIPII
jgi:hypothetical protein